MVHRLPDFESFVAARTLLERALALDTGYTRAKALICRLTEAARSERWLSIEAAASCLPLAEEVVIDHRNDAMALAFAGITIAFLGKQQRRGVHILLQAYALNPNSSHVLYASGWVHFYVGDQTTAINHFDRAIRINPLDPMIGQIRSGLGSALLMSGRVEESVATLERALEEAPEYTGNSWLSLAIGYWELGRVDEARWFAKKTSGARAGHDDLGNDQGHTSDHAGHAGQDRTQSARHRHTGIISAATGRRRDVPLRGGSVPSGFHRACGSRFGVVSAALSPEPERHIQSGTGRSPARKPQ